MNTPLYKQIYEYILDKINNDELRSGDRVPSEHELANQFNVSRITTQKALDLLESHKVIERIRGKGSFVLQKKTNKKLKSQTMNRSLNPPIVGLIIPDFFNSYGLEFVKALERKSSELNFHLLIKRSYGKVEEEVKIINSMIELNVDGIIVTPVHGQHYNSTLLQLVLNNFPVVLVDRFLRGIPANSVGTNNLMASKELTEYLISLGHRNIGYISPPLTGTSTIEDRFQGYKNALLYKGLKLRKEYVLTDLKSTLPSYLYKKTWKDKRKADKEKITQFILSNLEITAFVVCEYQLALILSKLLGNLDKIIPNDYSIVCFDSPNTNLSQLRFTHIKQNEKEMAAVAVNLLFDQLNDKKRNEKRYVNYKFIKGNSTSKLKHNLL